MWIEQRLEGLNKGSVGGKMLCRSALLKIAG